MSPDYDHIVGDNSLCWCAPQTFVFEETIFKKIMPGIYTARLAKRVLFIHYVNNLAPRRHGKPRKPRPTRNPRPGLKGASQTSSSRLLDYDE